MHLRSLSLLNRTVVAAMTAIRHRHLQRLPFGKTSVSNGRAFQETFIVLAKAAVRTRLTKSARVEAEVKARAGAVVGVARMS